MSKLAIGTANFGMKYGFKNQLRRINFDVVAQLLDFAWDNNIDTIDTAMGYGDSECVVGNYLKNNESKHFNIITKINTIESPLLHLNQSLTNLHQSEIYGVLIHNFNYFKNDNSLFDSLIIFKEEGRCKKIGFSLYYPEELQYLIDYKVPFDIIQITYSVFDRRFEYYFPILKKMNVEIHVRSVFLQGLFFLDTSKLGCHFDKVKNKIDKIQSISASTGLSIASLCINFVNDNNFIDKIIVGVDNLDNLCNNNKVLIDAEKVRQHIDNMKDLVEDDINILFPHLWKL